MFVYYFFFFKQKTAYELRISDWSSDVCSSDLKAIVKDARDQLASFDPPASIRPTENYLRPDRDIVGNIASGRKMAAKGPRRQLLGVTYRSEERRVGKECGSACRSGWPP